MNNFKKILYDTLYLSVGCFITAFSVNYILKPNGLITSGITGLAIILEKYLLIDYYFIYYIAKMCIRDSIYVLFNIHCFFIVFFYCSIFLIAEYFSFYLY